MSDLKYQQFKGNSAADIPAVSENCLYRAEIPYAPENYSEMSRKGYIFADRTLGVSIAVNKCSLDLDKMIRFSIEASSGDDEDVLNIALASFPFDRRFHVRPVPDNEVAGDIIRKWVSELSEVYVCKYKDKTVGFIDLEPYGDNDCFIHLAAVEERYRAAGVAVSLYAFALKKAKEKGCDKLLGRISAGNTAVMNLYTYLGGVFSEPVDVFVRNEI
jgi:GNAT superfamily N-acetyltransferase